MPQPILMGILPALALTTVPFEIEAAYPYVLFGSGLKFDHDARWILAMSCAAWLFAASSASSVSPSSRALSTTFILICMAGNLGAALAEGLIEFAAFAALMGYSFLGLIIEVSNNRARRAAILYVVLLVVADVILFEVALIAGSSMSDLSFSAVRATIAQSDSGPVFAWLTALAIVLKCGLWPVHQWVGQVFSSGRGMAAILVPGVPIGTNMLGLSRWLPLDGPAFVLPGIFLLALGVATIINSVFGWSRSDQRSRQDVWAVLAMAGASSIALGAGLAFPVSWQLIATWFNAMVSLGLISAMAFVFFSNKRYQELHSAALGRHEPYVRGRPNFLGYSVSGYARSFHARFEQVKKTACLSVVTTLGFMERLVARLGSAEHELGQWRSVVSMMLIICILMAALLSMY